MATDHAMTRLFTDRALSASSDVPRPTTAYSEDVEPTVVATPDLWARINKLANNKKTQDGTSD
jgi:hypothetical protein